MKKKTLFYSSLTVFIIACLSLIIYIIYPFIRTEKKATPPISDNKEIKPEAVLKENPIDFAPLLEQNKDVKGWITIPNTKINYPVLQSDISEKSFYLNHNIERKYEFSGCIYIDNLNKGDLSDPNTIIYGHNMLNGSMFANLHKFKNKDFFNENKYIYIYTPGHILTYEIFAAYRTSSRHILHYYDFSDKQVFEEYLNEAKHPADYISNVRSETPVSADDRIITLSTCITNDDYRYFVQGVLINDEPTK